MMYNGCNMLSMVFGDTSVIYHSAMVVDMWLTGFDVPSMAIMYIGKSMKGHFYSVG